MTHIEFASLFLFVASTAASAGTGPVFTLLPDDFWPTDVSADATRVVGYIPSTQTTGLWTSDNPGVVQDLGGALTAGNACISEDGTIIYGEATGLDGIKRASKWMGGTVWENLPQIPNGNECDSEHSSTWGMNGAGDVIVGLAWLDACDAHAFRWDPVNGSVDLGSTFAGRPSRANVCSADGSVIAGWQDADTGRLGCIWVNGVQSLITYNGHEVGEAMAISPNGQYIVGTANFEDNGAWLHNRLTGVTAALPNLDPKDFFSTALGAAVNNDGSIAFGSDGAFPPFNRKSIIWIDGVQQDLHTYLVQQGTTGIDGFISMGTPLGANENVTALVGFGFAFGGSPPAWLVTFPPSTDCLADVDNSGAVDVDDLVAVILSWGCTGTCPADINASGTVDVDDLIAVILGWGPCD